jgi:hypothetical protein
MREMQMSYLRKIKWEIIPDTKPEVIRNCPKCGEKTHFINTEKFRVNANKNNIDIWLIYQCSKCKATWNMAIYERINPEHISREEYNKFLANDRELAISYGFNIDVHNRNRAELILDCMDYHVVSRDLQELSKKENEQEIEICCKYPIELRVDRLLSGKLNISRSQIKNLHDKGLIYNTENKQLLKAKINDGMVIYCTCL